jgi:hypothetical protein
VPCKLCGMPHLAASVLKQDVNHEACPRHIGQL